MNFTEAFGAALSLFGFGRSGRTDGMIGSGVRGWLGAVLLCAACSSSAGGGSGGSVASGGGSDMGTGATAGAADPNGEPCVCTQGHTGAIGCATAKGCACVCNDVPCTTDGGLSSTQNCLDADCGTCEPQLAGPRNRDTILQYPAETVLMAPDETSYVLFDGFPNLGHYSQNGGVISISTDVALDSQDWDNTLDLLVASDGTLYSSVVVSALLQNEHDTAVIVHSSANGNMLERTPAPPDVVHISRLARSPKGKLYALATTADATFVAPMDSKGNLGALVEVPDFGLDVARFAANDQGDLVFVGNSPSAAFMSRIALLPAGGTALTDLYDASHDLVGNVAADPAGGWWFSSGSLDGRTSFISTLYHVTSGTDLSKRGEVTSPLVGNANQFSTQFALLSDSALLLTVTAEADQPQSIGRFADGKLIQEVDVTNGFTLATAGKLSATVLSRVADIGSPGFVQINFDARH
jgi:hypothetical protein